MNCRIPPAVVLCLSLLPLALPGAEQAAKKQATKEEIQARLAEHARRKASGESAIPTPATAGAHKANSGVSPVGAPVTTPGSTPAPTPPAAAPEEAKVLPKVEVKKDRITELDRQLGKQNQEIAREKKNTKPTALDETLNGSKISTALAIFGGQSSDDRSSIAKERVSMMEEERDMIEAIAQATSKEEKEELQKTLESMREMRRELENSLR